VRKRTPREEASRYDRSSRVAVAINQHRREFVGVVMATVATFAIFINMLFLQKGPHPAPIFAPRAAVKVNAPAPAVASAPVVNVLPPAQSVQTAPLTAPPATMAPNRAQTITDIQRELNRRGYYEGALDGIWGARTDAAARDFVQASGVKVAPDATDALLRAILATPVKAPAGRGAAPARPDPIAQLIAPTQKVAAIQRALADFGYGQLKPTGVYDPETRAAIEKFERDRRLPITGQMSEAVVRELAAMTGRPLE
jgi:peptidoglycan hydrolase-like protein with peptidoglycan-binding domain